MKRIIVTIAGVAAVSVMVMGNTASCGGSGGGPARSASYAGDGITQFGYDDGSKNVNYANKGATGKLRFNKTYNAHKQNPGDVENCRWSLYSIDSLGRTEFKSKGTYANAKIKVGDQVTRKWYLKSLDCGLWQ